MFKISHVRILFGRRLAAFVVAAIGGSGCSAGAAPASAASSAPVHMASTQHALGAVLRRPDEWFATAEGRRTADVIVSWQNENGGWWKVYDTEHPRPAEDPPPDLHSGPPGDAEDAWRSSSTFDNAATYTEMRILARAATVTGAESYKGAFLKGLQFIFDAQYPNGGWPQRFPIQHNYGHNITFNDGAMVGVMTLLRDAGEGRRPFEFVGEAERARCREAVARGVDCTLKCQVKENGVLTVWCQQHDPVTLEPAAARAYELPSLCSAESVGIVNFLMEMPKPDGRVVAAVDGAVGWFERSKIMGKRIESVRGGQYENGRDKVVVDDPGAGPIWARFYDLETNKPFFVARDGVKRWSMAEISWERRNGYGWYTDSPKRVIEAYPGWKRRVTGKE